MKSGVVIGKFRPPHLGHKYLIDTAFSQTDELTVIICETKEDIIPGKLRYEWLKKIHPDINIILVETDGFDENDSKLWADMTVKWLGYHPDLVFTSENYGDPYSKFLGAEHVCVDLERKTVPISATKINQDPMGNLEYLHPVVRSYFVKRICVVGAESTGTTTLAKALAEHYKTNWVPEFGRLFSAAKLYHPSWEDKDFLFIADQQNKIEDELALTVNKILICDTDSFATSLWQWRYMGRATREVLNTSKERKIDLYLLTDINIPFVQDGTRDGEHIRVAMHQKFVDELENEGKRYILLSGTHEDRLQTAIREIEKIMNK